jgi:hypothetical protein
MGRITGARPFQRPWELLRAVQDVFLTDEITIA